MSEADVKWYPVEYWSTVKIGERVRLEQTWGDTVEVEVRRVFSDEVHSRANSYVKGNGWTLFISRPPVALPREPGFYLAGRVGARLVVELLNSPPGQWVDASDSQSMREEEVAELGSLTRLRPEGEERREVAGELLRWVIDQIVGAHRHGWSDEQVAAFEVVRDRLNAVSGESS